MNSPIDGMVGWDHRIDENEAKKTSIDSIIVLKMCSKNTNNYIQLEDFYNELIKILCSKKVKNVPLSSDPPSGNKPWNALGSLVS